MKKGSCDHNITSNSKGHLPIGQPIEGVWIFKGNGKFDIE